MHILALCVSDGSVCGVMQEVWRQAGEAQHLSQLLEVCLHISTAVVSCVG